MNFRAPAEMFTGRQSAAGRARPYRRFATLAEAVRFAVEKQPGALICTAIETAETRLQNKAISAAYDSLADRGAATELPGRK